MKRMEILSEHQSTPREYKRVKQKCQLRQSCEDVSSSQVDVSDTMSANELRFGKKIWHSNSSQEVDPSTRNVQTSAKKSVKTL